MKTCTIVYCRAEDALVCGVAEIAIESVTAVLNLTIVRHTRGIAHPPCGLTLIAADRKMIRYRSRRPPDVEHRWPLWL